MHSIYVNVWGQVVHYFERRYVNAGGWFVVETTESIIDYDPWYFGA